MKPTYMEMARVVERVAGRYQKLVDDGAIILPSAADIAAGGIDYRTEAMCLAAAATELSATARLLAGNDQSIARRKAG